ncbi:MAG: beta-N-acetylglucosaminidase domain-containing protein, partial [Muribaculaceae bacterium]|nr:beta-N-acetylglucosaminidase domain-containing protein [Muribaculaceae bacterium]
MKIKHIALTALSLTGAFAAANAQQVEISPVPAKVEWGGKAFDSATASYYLTGTNSDEAVATLVAKHFTAAEGGNVEVVVATKGEAAAAPYESKIPAQSEGYYLTVTPGKAVVAGADAAGTFYGVQTLLQVLSAPEVQQVTITDYPANALRGVIEGFYGNPWSFDDRVSQFDFYGANKMNIYIYGPKDDPYHHSQWYTPYPEAEAAKMKELVKHATDNKVKFVWAMHPSNSIASDSDRKKALDKFEQMYGLGVRAFSIFFDDISAESVNNQVSYLNFLTDNFVNKKPDVEPLIVCPTQYNKSWSSGSYLSTMGKGLYPEIKIMWTGNSVVDMIQKEDATWFTGQTGRKPFIWLNYPVNDYGQHNLLMGPFTGNGTDIASYIEAFCSNPMQYAEASKVALYSIADFSWNPTAYNADKTWERSMTVLVPEAPEAFRRFCITNVDVAPSTHGLRLYGET